MILANCILVGVVVLSSGFVGVVLTSEQPGSIYLFIGKLQSK